MKTAVPTIILLAALAGAGEPASAGDLRVAYRHNLADFSGTIPFMGSKVRVDGVQDEAYVLDGRTVRVFSPSGMETFAFDLEAETVRYFDVAVAGSGDIFLLGGPVDGSAKERFFIQRCDFRGTPKEKIGPRGLPERLAGFSPNLFAIDNGAFVLASAAEMTVVFLAANGGFQRAVDLAGFIDQEDKEKGAFQMGGFAVAPDATLLFTIPEFFRAYAVSPDGKGRSFGQGGSRPGQFGVIGGIAAGRDGSIFIADKMRSVVLVFDKNLEFVSEFGGYGERPEDLVRPDQLATSPSGKLFVTQMRQRGISVFEVSAN